MKTPDLADYDYEFPEELIAQAPASPRESAKLLVYDKKTKEVSFDTFRHIGKYLPSKSLLVFNETKVIPARLVAKKETGGRVRMLYLGTKGKNLEFLADRRLKAGDTVTVAPRVSLKVKKIEDKGYLLNPSFSAEKIFEVLERFGETPLPPYIKHTSLKGKKLEREYQAVFAKHKGSVAAPTASLHFTNPLLKKLKRAGHDIVFVTLHVNLGTFAPLTDEHLKSGKLHREYFEVSDAAAKKISRARKEHRPVIAVGTTVLRTLESAGKKGIKKMSGETDIFIRPGHKWRIVDGLITNFHVPKSSLLMLVSALMGREEVLRVYGEAIRKKFRLFSFGDGMLIK